MKHMLASLTIGACLLLPSAGVVLAANLHTTPPSSISGTGKGQTGSNPNPPNSANPNGHACGTSGGTAGPSAGAIASPGSPFAGAAGVAGGQYAGAGANTGTPANSAAASMYDNACFQAP
jgi:hypothetical protein